MLALGRELGAEETIDYEQQDFILESVGGDMLGRSLSATAFRVRLVTVSNSSQQPVTFQPGLLYGRGLAVSGFSLAAESATGGPVAVVGRSLELSVAGNLRTVVGRVFPLQEAPTAQRYLSQRRSLGDVVLVP